MTNIISLEFLLIQKASLANLLSFLQCLFGIKISKKVCWYVEIFPSLMHKSTFHKVIPEPSKVFEVSYLNQWEKRIFASLDELLSWQSNTNLTYVPVCRDRF